MANNHLPPEAKIDVANALQMAIDGISGYENTQHDTTDVFYKSDFRPFNTRYIYKFTSEDVFEKYIKGGEFLLSSLERYRDMEGQGNPAGDRFEGASFCFYDVGKYELGIATLSGFDSFIFSAAKDLVNKEEMKRRFGPVVLKIELMPFARQIANMVGSTEPDVRLVRYTNLKIYTDKIGIRLYDDDPPIRMSPNLAIALREKGRIPSVFLKPKDFSWEREVRIVFRQKSDVDLMLGVKNHRLSRYVTRIE